MTEFFWQGDLEASLGLPVSAFFNRHTTSVAQCQIGFINIIIRPFYVEVRKLLGDVRSRKQADPDNWRQAFVPEEESTTTEPDEADEHDGEAAG